MKGIAAMSFDPNDLRITSYLLDELRDEEVTAFEAEMEANEDLRKAIEGTRRVVDQLSHELRSEPLPALSAERRARVLGDMHAASGEAAPVTTQTLRPSGAASRRWWAASAVLAVAASLLLVCGLIYRVSKSRVEAARQVAEAKAAVRDARMAATETENLVLNRREHAGSRPLTSLLPPGESGSRPPSASVAAGGEPSGYGGYGGGLGAQPVPAALEGREKATLGQLGRDFSGPRAPGPGLATGSAVPSPSGNERLTRSMRESEAAPTMYGAADPGSSMGMNGVPAAEAYDGGRPEMLRESVASDPDHGLGPGSAGDRYQPIVENAFKEVKNDPLSTFSIDVDTASYSKVRMYLMQQGVMPRPDAVRIEELVNYFTYDYAPPTGNTPFAAHLEVAECPWAPAHRLVRIGIKGKDIDRGERPTSNLVFLLDVSGSMNRPNKLPLVKQGMKMLVDQLSENDSVAIVVYAAATGLVLDSTTGDHKQVILDALDRLNAGGSTNGGAGIQLAYQTALDRFVQGGVNRVILCTDGDFNVGVTGTDQLVRLAEQNAKTGVFLSVLGFGMGNHNDAMLEQISGKGNGNYAFIDTETEARKVLVEQMAGTLVTIAKDVKIQVEFNPQQVAAYRLIGYENRILAAQDFNDDKKDAGEIGAGHTVTALYEIVPAGANTDVRVPAVDELRYQTKGQANEAAASGELLTLKMRFKQPDGDTSSKLEFPARDEGKRFGQASKDFRFAAAAAAFGMLLRDSQHKGNVTYAGVLEIATESATGDTSGYRDEFLKMVAKAKELTAR
jgi:Ca-activated chloride channel family protein